MNQVALSLHKSIAAARHNSADLDGAFFFLNFFLDFQGRGIIDRQMITMTNVRTVK